MVKGLHVWPNREVVGLARSTSLCPSRGAQAPTHLREFLTWSRNLLLWPIKGIYETTKDNSPREINEALNKFEEKNAKVSPSDEIRLCDEILPKNAHQALQKRRHVRGLMNPSYPISYSSSRYWLTPGLYSALTLAFPIKSAMIMNFVFTHSACFSSKPNRHDCNLQLR